MALSRLSGPPAAPGLAAQARRTRLFFLVEVSEDLLDRRRIFDADDDPNGAAADCAGLDVDPEHPLQALRPRRRPPRQNSCRPDRNR